MASNSGSDPMMSPDFASRARLASGQFGSTASPTPYIDLSVLASALEADSASAFGGDGIKVYPASFGESVEPQMPHPYMVIPDVSPDAKKDENGELLDGEEERLIGLIYLPDGCFVYDGEARSFDSGYVKSAKSRYARVQMADHWYSFTEKAVDVAELAVSAPNAATPLYAHVLKDAGGNIQPVRLSTKTDPREPNEKDPQTDPSAYRELVTKVKICSLYAETGFGPTAGHRYVLPSNPCVESAIILASGGDTTDLKPFTVRWDAGSSSWAVYLPESTLGGMHFVRHLEAAGQTGWYKVNGSALASGQGSYVVTAHVKRRVRIGDDGDAGALVLVACRHVDTQEPSNLRAGDVWSADIAFIDVSDAAEGETPRRMVSQMFAGSVPLLDEAAERFDIYWTSDPPVSEAPVYTPHVSASRAPWLLSVTTADLELPSSGTVFVYYVVDCSGDTPVPSVATDLPADLTARAAVLIYLVLDGRVTDDLRGTAFQQILFYR